MIHESAQGNPYVVGLDGGGSGCRARFALSDGTILGEASGGPVNLLSDAVQAIENVSAVLQAVVEVAGLQTEVLLQVTAHIGIAGVMTREDAQTVARQISVGHCSVTDDRAIALVGALGQGDGVLLAIGTGTIIAAQRQGNLRNMNGWGMVLSDQASGAWLGRALLETLLLCHDGMRTHSRLTMDTFGQYDHDPIKLVKFASKARPADFARCAPSVIEAASRKDEVGLELLGRGARFLNEALLALGVRGGDKLCLTGGIGPHYLHYLSEEYQNLVCPPMGSALDGAMSIAHTINGRRER